MCFGNQAKRIKVELNDNKTLISDSLILDQNTVEYLWDTFGVYQITQQLNN